MADSTSCVDVIPALIVGSIAGPAQLPGVITAATDPPPQNMDSNTLPHLYVFSGEADYDFGSLGNDDWLEVRTFRVQTAVMTYAASNPEARETRIRSVLQSVMMELAQTDEFDYTDHVFDCTILGDSGPAILPEYEGKYLGFEIRLQVQWQKRA